MGQQINSASTLRDEVSIEPRGQESRASPGTAEPKPTVRATAAGPCTTTKAEPLERIKSTTQQYSVYKGPYL